MNFRLFWVAGDRGVSISISAPESGPWINSPGRSHLTPPLFHTHLPFRKESLLSGTPSGVGSWAHFSDEETEVSRGKGLV